MFRCQSPPRVWMMTDERQGEGLWRALSRLPRGAGVVFRHYHLPLHRRRTLFGQVRRLCRKRGLVLLLAGDARKARTWGAAGCHGGGRERRWRIGCWGLRSAPAHDFQELRAARQAGADLVFLSPVFPTDSHPGSDTLGPVRFAQLARRAGPLPVIALGGMNELRGRKLAALGAYGWAAIDAWSG